ncbi:Pyridoxine 4-dehydrogenase [Pestalotiopsis sp. 9143b]|nr:Pyridoxine 4-dehydrogenase [Pestalotiopsis sp. 9143b]
MPQLVGKEVGSIGYGLMGFTWRPNPMPMEEAIESMRAALADGLNFWNAGEFYGTPEYNSMHLLEAYFAKYPADADRVVLSVKGAAGDGHGPDASPEGVRRSIDNCMRLLKGRKKIDIFECARRDHKTPLQVTFDVMDKEYVQTGKIGGIGISEVKAETLREAAKIAKIAAVEIEFSLFVSDPLQNGLVEVAKEHNIPIVAYSPLGRGFLTGQIKTPDDVPEMLRKYPRFQPDVFPTNMELVKHIGDMAAKKKVTPAQLSINWVRAAAQRAGVTALPIPGATTIARVHENAKVVDITDDEYAELDAILKKIDIIGARYPDFIPHDG